MMVGDCGVPCTQGKNRDSHILFRFPTLAQECVMQGMWQLLCDHEGANENGTKCRGGSLSHEEGVMLWRP